MPDPSRSTPSVPTSPIAVAQVLDEAADLLLIRGVCRDGTYGVPGGPRCLVGALRETLDLSLSGLLTSGTYFAVRAAIFGRLPGHPLLTYWSDNTDDDFEVIDTLRHAAKDLRATAAPA